MCLYDRNAIKHHNRDMGLRLVSLFGAISNVRHIFEYLFLTTEQLLNGCPHMQTKEADGRCVRRGIDYYWDECSVVVQFVFLYFPVTFVSRATIELC